MKTIRLTKGLGEKGKSHCVMAATSIVAEEPFTDKPSCVCTTITSALIYLNDSYGDDDAARELALGHFPWIIIGTNGTVEHKLKRMFLFADWAVKTCGIKCDPIVDHVTARAAAAYAANAATANAAAAATAYAAYAANAANAAARVATIMDKRDEFIAYIESVIIPVYTTMPIERGFRMDQLTTN